MVALTPATCHAFLERFERLDGAVVETLTLDLQASTATLLVRAYDREAGDWRTLRCELRGELELRWHQAAQTSRVLLDDHLEIIWLEGRTYFVLDPLQTSTLPPTQWTLEIVRRSSCYLGAARAAWSSDAG